MCKSKPASNWKLEKVWLQFIWKNFRVYVRLSLLLDEPFLEDLSFRATLSADVFKQLCVPAVRHLLWLAVDRGCVNFSLAEYHDLVSDQSLKLSLLLGNVALAVAGTELLSHLQSHAVANALLAHLHLTQVCLTHALVLLGGVASEGTRARVFLGAVRAIEHPDRSFCLSFWSRGHITGSLHNLRGSNHRHCGAW